MLNLLQCNQRKLENFSNINERNLLSREKFDFVSTIIRLLFSCDGTNNARNTRWNCRSLCENKHEKLKSQKILFTQTFMFPRTETTTIFWQKFLSYFLAATKEIFAGFNIDFSLNIYDGNSSDQKQSRRRKVIAEFGENYRACELSKHLIMNNKSLEFPLMNSLEVKG